MRIMNCMTLILNKYKRIKYLGNVLTWDEKCDTENRNLHLICKRNIPKAKQNLKKQKVKNKKKNC